MPMTPDGATLAHVVIVTPVLDDWTSFATLLGEIDKVSRENNLHVRVFAIDDGSSQPPPKTSGLPPEHSIKEVQIIRLVRNLGHQRAIAVGLVEAYRQIDKSIDTAVIVMDSDGEDPPGDIPALLRDLARTPQGVAVASRRRRYEPLPFKIGYTIYKRMYAALCGQNIDFGNFCAISPRVLEQLVHTPEIWNHLAASISKLRCPIVRVPHNRGRRYDGRSKMTMQSLVLHGMSALSVYTDIILIRIIFATLALAGLAGVAILMIIALYFFSSWTIRGWTSILAGVMFAILVQVLAASLAASFLLLSNRSTIGRNPLHELPIFVRDRQILT